MKPKEILLSTQGNKIKNSIRNGLVFLLVLPIKFYQLSISPLLPKTCRHTPSCSQYAIEALKIHGPFKGFILGTWRILRCNPWGTSGYDPVPLKKNKSKTPENHN